MDFTLKKIFSKEKQIDIPANASNEVLICPDIDSSTPTYFLSLRLYSRDSLVSSNFYALSTTPDSIHEKKTTWHDTRSSYANLTELNTLPEVKLETKHEFIKEGKDFLVKAAVRNPTNKLAFMVYLSVKQGNTETAVLPIFWDENYVTLLPGETRTIVGRFHAVDLHGSLPRLEITGWNVK
jgi:exo-1,4-beta-D-glucosaminidase